MNIFFRELKANRKALIIWSICIFLYVLAGMSKYTAYSSGANSDVFSKMPATMRALLGIGSFDVTKLSGFFAFLFPYVAIITAIHAALIGSGIIAKEERDKTTEFLMVKPVSRTTVITSKLLAALFNILVVNIVTLISSIVFAEVYNKGKSINHEIIMFLLSMFIMQLIFMSIGAFLATYMKNAKSSGSMAAIIVIVSYVISKITDVTDKVNGLNILSPFKYFDYQDIVNGGNINFLIALLSLLIVLVFSASAYYFYLRRDLKV